MKAATQGELRIECKFPIKNIAELEIRSEQNRHGFIRIKGSLPEESGDEMIFDQLEGTAVSAWIRDELVFKGMIGVVTIIQEGQYYGIEFIGITSTQKLDYEKKSRSFQDQNITFEKVIKTVLEDWPNPRAGFQVREQQIEVPVYQIEETDWEFIMRMASHMETGIIAPLTGTGIRLQIGVPRGIKREINESGLTILKTWGSKQHQICYEIACYDNWELGDRIDLNGREHTIINKICVLQQGLLRFLYTVGQEADLTVRPYGNPGMIGRLLSGTVKEVKDERVKVELDIDAGQRKGDLYWYPWHPEVGNLMYCMPEIEQKVYIRLGDEKGKRAEAVYGIRANGSGHPEMKPKNRYFTTAERKRLFLLPDSLGFIDQKQQNPLRMTLDDHQGISLESNKMLTVIAQKTLGITGKNITLQAPKEISVVRRSGEAPTVLNLCNGFDSIGTTNKVSMSGAGTGSFPVFPPQEEEVYQLGEAAGAVAVSTPRCGFSDRTEQQIEGILVDKLVNSCE